MRNLPYGSRPVFTYKDLFVISDVHSELEKLRSLINNLPLTSESIIVFVGDLIDNGPNGIGVLRFIKELKTKYQVYVIEGNHESIFKRIVEGTYAIQGALDAEFLNEFLYHGANSVTPKEIEKVLIKYDLKPVLWETIPYFEATDLIITHAPIDKRAWSNLNFDEWQDDDYENDWIKAYPLDYLGNHLMWNFVDNEEETLKGMTKFLICGHQNHRCKYDAPRIFPTRAYLDCGAGYDRSKPIFAMHFPSKKIYQS